MEAVQANSALSPKPFMKYLREKYSELYQL